MALCGEFAVEVPVDLLQGRLCDDSHNFIYYYLNSVHTYKLNYN
jgi:hypothetical protein